MRRILVALKSDGVLKPYDEKRFEELFEITYLPHLVFSDWRAEKWIRKKCAEAEKKGKIGDLALWLGKLHGQALEDAKVPDISVRWMGEHIGYGLFANRAFKPWEFLGEYTGVLRPKRFFRPDINDFCFMYPKEWFSLRSYTIDSGSSGNYTRYINHSDTPNCESVSVYHEGIFHILFRTILPISAGTQLTYDYGDIYWYKRNKIENDDAEEVRLQNDPLPSPLALEIRPHELRSLDDVPRDRF